MIYFKKSQPAPDCLEIEKQKQNGKYNCGCVIKRLKTDFENKCYLCEDNTSTTLNVEHFKPHHQGKDKDLKFDWNNLFLVCGHCNTTKLAKVDYDNILNCTDEKDVVEQQLKYEFKPFPYEKVKITAINQNEKVINTQNLLNAIFNGSQTELKESETYNLRKRLLKEIKKYQDFLIEYDEAYDEEHKQDLLRKIKSHLNSASPFASFKRQIIKDNAELFKNFGCYFN